MQVLAHSHSGPMHYALMVLQENTWSEQPLAPTSTACPQYRDHVSVMGASYYFFGELVLHGRFSMLSTRPDDWF